MNGKALGCILATHVGCFCSCRGSICCGCHQSRPPNSKFYLHCLLCDEDFSSEVDSKGEFDQEVYVQGPLLDEARQRINMR